ncbi:hypothetical protein [Spongiactinospora sp. TRM90649]|uniref:hypothetical protein n=1 Tax=Spongiactinospora sp. TRM90649 TaxID=3031114 RepID=UPI0023F7E5B1|nr:hypothetical protein [Spongiactinospora sp. TRM90649]MDF5755858.1 hypothetical protein [Spongiactinospora sp. TRM90649]
MSAETLIWVAVVAAVVVAIVAVGYVVLQQQRRHRLRERFGPEYERTINERDNRRDAERELRAREERVADLDIRPLSAQSRKGYAARWTEVQEQFVDAPGFAVTAADQLVTEVMHERGYPTEKFEQRLSDLSVSHGRTLDHYREAHEISGRAARREASTEELRQAMVHYRALFEELLVDGAPEDERRPIPAQGGPRDNAPAKEERRTPQTTAAGGRSSGGARRTEPDDYVAERSANRESRGR